MNALPDRMLRAAMVLVAWTAMTIMTGCSITLPNGAIGNAGVYNYSPSIIESGNLRQFWWCSQGENPLKHSQVTDSIYYASVNMVTGASVGPKLVLAETPGAWDSAYTCNPKVINGVFVNPLGDGVTYTYALYYAATNSASGVNNSIGVAFSNDGIAWNKYPQPVIASTSASGYGVGQPSLYNADGKSAITLLYENADPIPTHVAAVSNDGIHFTQEGILTENGLDPDDPTPIWGDMAYDSKAGEWYAVYCRPLRPPITTGGVTELGQYGVELYKIDKNSLFTGQSPWKQLGIMDTNSTGYESNFIAGLVHDPYGNLNTASYPIIELYVSTSWPQPAWDATPAEAGHSARIESWILMPLKWDPSADPQLPLNRYYNGETHEVSTGWVTTDARFKLEKALGHLYATPQHGAITPFYGCKRDKTDYFISLDSQCEGERVLGTNGYAFSKPQSGQKLIPLYRCSSGYDHFVSADPGCEGQTTDELLGYVLP